MHLGKAGDLLELFEKSIGYYLILPLCKWPKLGVCHTAGHGRATTPMTCNCCIPLVKQHYQGQDSGWGGSSPPIALLSHEMSSINHVMQKQVVELLSFLCISIPFFLSRIVAISSTNPKWSFWKYSQICAKSYTILLDKEEMKFI